MEITIKEIESSIKSVLENAEILSTDSVYEHIDGSDNLKLVIFFNKLLDKNINILYTKLIFTVNANKSKLVNKSFLYLFDINCVYSKVGFNDIDNFKKKLKSILTTENFGINIKILSKFIKSPAFLINDWFKKNDANNINVSNVSYNPKVSILPCKSLFFAFNLNVNNNDIEIIITKEKENSFIFSFKIFDEVVNVEKTNLNTLVETIGDTLKNKLNT